MERKKIYTCVRASVCVRAPVVCDIHARYIRIRMLERTRTHTRAGARYSVIYHTLIYTYNILFYAVRACCYTAARVRARETHVCVCVCARVCVLAHELFARGPTDFEITPSDWPGPAVYIKSTNGGRATGRVPRGPPVHRAAYIQQYCRPTDIHTSICQVFIYALFFFFPNFSHFSTSTTVRTYVLQHYCLPVASIWRQQQQHIAVVSLSSPSLSRVVRFFAVAIPLFSLVSDTAITLLLYRLLYHCCCFCYVFWYLCVSTPRTRNRKSYDLLVRTTHIPRSFG